MAEIKRVIWHGTIPHQDRAEREVYYRVVMTPRARNRALYDAVEMVVETRTVDALGQPAWLGVENGVLVRAVRNEALAALADGWTEPRRERGPSL